jgi:hypothetical protein
VIRAKDRPVGAALAIVRRNPSKTMVEARCIAAFVEGWIMGLVLYDFP